jgi:transcriptional regulator with XRE-family HTH domain
MRYHLGLSVDEVSELCGLRHATWSKWEHGTAPRGMNRIVERIAAVTNVDRDWLMWGGSLPPSTKWSMSSELSASGAAAA